jgi:ABC-type phosphate transport system substrate-binding protein
MTKFSQTLGLLLLTCTSVTAQEPRGFVVIVNKNNPVAWLSSSKIKIIFLRNVSRWPFGAEIVPVDLPDRSPTRRAFLEAVMRSTPDEMAVYWIDQKISRSLSKPVQVGSASEARALVASHIGAVAYVPLAEADDTVRILEVK